MEYPITKELSIDKINEMEERRISMLNEAGIDEGDVLSKANDDLGNWDSYFSENITVGKADLNFALREQWTAIEKSEFTRLFKPAMVCNKIYSDVKKVIGEQRKNKPDLIVRSLTGKATQEQINLRADMVRTISYKSQNDLVYQTAFKSAICMGYGAFQISLDYESPRSFNKIIKYNLIPEPINCSFDPGARMPHKGDGNFCNRQYVFSKKEFEATYPYIFNPVSYSDSDTLLNFQWQAKDNIIILERFVKEWFPLIIYKLSNGKVVTEEEWEEMQKRFSKQKDNMADSIAGEIIIKELPKVIDRRQTQDYRIMQYQCLQNQIIDFAEWPSRQLPIVFVDGDSYYFEGRQYTKSLIHEAIDPQKFLNYIMSEIASEIKNRRREQWIGTADNIAGQEHLWRNPEVQAGILIAKPDLKTGMMPQKMPPFELSQTLLQNYERAGIDIREIMGMSEAENANGSADISGKAKRERKLDMSMSSYVFFDNLNQSVEQGGRIVNDLLPYIIGEDERSMVMNTIDNKSKTVIFNKLEKDGSKSNQLDKEDYDVEIDTGPSFAVQKEVSLEFLQQTMQVSPQSFPLIADLWAKNLDVQFMPQISERFKTMVPPEILAKENGEPPPPPKPNPEQQAMQMAQQLHVAEIKERAEELRIRQEKHELDKVQLMMDAQELQTKFSIHNKDNATAMHKTELDYSAKIAKILADVHTKTTEKNNKGQH